VVQAILGIHPHERVTPQPVRISLTLVTDIRAAARSDAIADALDYGRAASLAGQIARDGQFQLAETLAEAIAARLLAEFPGAVRVRVEVEKPEALPDAAGVGVRIERGRHP
jgi:dihydroneopterin aldolase